MRDFEDYCWRDLLTGDMLRIFSAYHRERAVDPRSALLVVHPSPGFRAVVQPDWPRAAGRLAERVRTRGMLVVHSLPPDATPARDLAPQPGDRTCPRPCESAFFLAELERVLTQASVEGLIICGAPTSGPLRATAVEAKSYGYKAAIAEEATGDEAALLHKVALFDIAHKYADVMTLDEVIAALDAARLEVKR